MISRRDTLKSIALIAGGAALLPKQGSGAKKAKPGQFS